MVYVFNDYIEGAIAVFDSEQKAKDFMAKLNNYLNYTLSSSEYEIKKYEINPTDIKKWLNE